MAKIDVTKIDGYKEMSAEDKVKALESYEYEDSAAELKRYKDAVTKANSEAAEYKRQLKERMSEEELKAKEETDRVKELETQLAEALKRESISKDTAKYLSLGYEQDLARETAEAWANGDKDKVFANQQKFQESYDKKIRADILNNTPTPPAGSGTEGVDFLKLRDEAISNGDYAAVAYYTRMNEQQNKKP